MAVSPRQHRWVPTLAVVSMVVAACAGGAPRQDRSGQTLATAAIGDTIALPTTGRPPTPTTPSTGATTTVPTTAATTVPATVAPPRPLVIHGTGDLNVDPDYIPALASEGYEHALSGIDGLFTTDDLTVVNLECTPSNIGARQLRPFNFRCDPEALPVLAADGVDVANLGNNHSMDYGPDALVDSLANVRAAGLAVVGAGANRTEAFRPALLERGGRTIAVLGFGAVYLARDWVATDDRPGMSDGLDLSTMVAAIESAAASADVVIVTIHWCCELETTPNARNRDHAEAMIKAGATVIFGHHHHRLQPLEVVDGSAVAWGLGNFVWPRLSQAGSDSAIARVIISGDGDVTACLLPVTIVSSGHPVLDDPSATSCPGEPVG
ncbi:MAG: CapA family protein [Acidimicrobiia bacterium]|nr:CapA family protein [Acidimicrobiia bacterium]